jgi:uncharacterized RDD family membrane protein YckC
VRLDDRMTFDTPEGVTIDVVLAGLGSRFIARLLDTLIQLAIILALAFAMGAFSDSGVFSAFGIVMIFLVVLLYDVPFEVLGHGRTPGKRAAGIQVVDRQGGPVRFLASMIRNVLRIVDFLPVFYVVGSGSIVSTGHDQRLGDLAAGTVVTRTRFPGLAKAHAAPPTVPVASVSTWDVSAVQSDEVDVVHHFLDRRLSLSPHVRAYFAGALAARIAPKVPGAPAGIHPEYLLEGVVVAKQARS